MEAMPEAVDDAEGEGAHLGLNLGPVTSSSTSATLMISMRTRRGTKRARPVSPSSHDGRRSQLGRHGQGGLMSMVGSRDGSRGRSTPTSPRSRASAVTPPPPARHTPPHPATPRHTPPSPPDRLPLVVPACVRAHGAAFVHVPVQVTLHSLPPLILHKPPSVVGSIASTSRCASPVRCGCPHCGSQERTPGRYSRAHSRAGSVVRGDDASVASLVSRDASPARADDTGRHSKRARMLDQGYAAREGVRPSSSTSSVAPGHGYYEGGPPHARERATLSAALRARKPHHRDRASPTRRTYRPPTTFKRPKVLITACSYETVAGLVRLPASAGTGRGTRATRECEGDAPHGLADARARRVRGACVARRLRHPPLPCLHGRCIHSKTSPTRRTRSRPPFPPTPSRGLTTRPSMRWLTRSTGARRGSSSATGTRWYVPSRAASRLTPTHPTPSYPILPYPIPSFPILPHPTLLLPHPTPSHPILPHPTPSHPLQPC